MISAMVKQSCTSATWMSAGARPAHVIGQATGTLGRADGSGVGAVVQGDIACLTGADDMDGLIGIAPAISSATRNTAAAPSEIGEQSKRRNGQAMTDWPDHRAGNPSRSTSGGGKPFCAALAFLLAMISAMRCQIAPSDSGRRYHGS